jgi:hypothetical protein
MDAFFANTAPAASIDFLPNTDPGKTTELSPTTTLGPMITFFKIKRPRSNF